jgi:hypothetical protein
MARCSICAHMKSREVNRRLLLGEQAQIVAAEYGFNAQTLRYHRRRHLPWRKEGSKAVTADEKMVDLEYQLGRLRALAESGERVDQAVRVLVAQRNLLELQMRKQGYLGATHMKLFPAKTDLDEDMEVIFENGRPRTVTVSEAKRLREAQEPKQ